MDTHENRQSLATPAARALCLLLLEQCIHLTSKRCRAGFFLLCFTLTPISQCGNSGEWEGMTLTMATAQFSRRKLWFQAVSENLEKR